MNWTNDHEPMRPSEIKPMEWEQLGPQTFGPSTAKFLLLLLAVALLMGLSGCSKAVSIAPMPPPPANLESNCRPLDNVPDPLIDPERALWESQLIARYMECSVKHRLTVEAWLAAIRQSKD